MRSEHIEVLRALPYQALLQLLLLCGVLSSGVCHGAASDLHWTDMSTTFRPNQPASYTPRENPAVALFQNKIWVVGGCNNRTVFKDVWSSPDGTNWTQVADMTEFPGRQGEQLFAFQDKLVMAGGFDRYGSTAMTDVWSSSNGKDWTQLLTTPFYRSASSRYCAYHNQLLAIAAHDNTSTTLGIWSSDNLTSWTLIQSAPPFVPGAVSCAEFNGALLVLDSAKKLWQSADGVTWSAVNMAAAPGAALFTWQGKLWCHTPKLLFEDTKLFSSADGIIWNQTGSKVRDLGASAGTPLLPLDNKLLLLAGASQHSVWVTTDAVHWSHIGGQSVFSPGIYGSAVVFKNRLWKLGGILTGTARDYRNTWCSVDGTSWTQMQNDLPIFSGGPNYAFTFKNKVWFLDYFKGVVNSTDMTTWTAVAALKNPGVNSYYQTIFPFGNSLLALSRNNDHISSSTDGVHWKDRGATGIPPRYNFSVFELNGRLFVCGGNNIQQVGQSSVSVPFSDTWSTTNGLTWRQQSTNRPILGGPTAVLNNRVYMLANVTSVTTEVWSSANGINWKTETAHPAFPLRDSYLMCAYGGELLLLGGIDPSTYSTSSEDEGSQLGEVWSSPDGVRWRQIAGPPSFLPRIYDSGVDFNGRMWLIGGEFYRAPREVWSSPDGRQWSAANLNAPFGDRRQPTVVNYHNRMWLMGGSSARDVWNSADGITWTTSTSQTPFTYASGGGVLNDRLYVLGGTTNTAMRLWSSIDGAAWDDSGSSTTIPFLVAPTVLNHAGRIWVIGNGPQSGDTLHVWSTSDGQSWQQSIPDIDLGRSSNRCGAVWNGRMWLISGRSDILSSSDGAHWKVEAFSPPIQDHLYPAVLAFGRRMWVIGGYTFFSSYSPSQVYLNDVWSTPVEPSAAARPDWLRVE